MVVFSSKDHVTHASLTCMGMLGFRGGESVYVCTSPYTQAVSKLKDLQQHVLGEEGSGKRNLPASPSGDNR